MGVDWNDGDIFLPDQCFSGVGAGSHLLPGRMVDGFHPTGSTDGLGGGVGGSIVSKASDSRPDGGFATTRRRVSLGGGGCVGVVWRRLGALLHLLGAVVVNRFSGSVTTRFGDAGRFTIDIVTPLDDLGPMAKNLPASGSEARCEGMLS